LSRGAGEQKYVGKLPTVRFGSTETCLQVGSRVMMVARLLYVPPSRLVCRDRSK
jgi:hypothetical protein